jgi:hypothetical protein
MNLSSGVWATRIAGDILQTESTDGILAGPSRDIVLFHEVVDTTREHPGVNGKVLPSTFATFLFQRKSSVAKGRLGANVVSIVARLNCKRDGSKNL